MTQFHGTLTKESSDTPHLPAREVFLAGQSLSFTKSLPMVRLWSPFFMR